MSGYRNGHRHGEEGTPGIDGRERRRVPERGSVRRVHEVEPAILAGGAPRHVRREEYGDQPPRAGGRVRREGVGVRLPLHRQGGRIGEQDLSVSADQGPPQHGVIGGVPGGEDQDDRNVGVSTLSPRGRRRRTHCRADAQNRQARVDEVPRRPPPDGRRIGTGLPRRGVGGSHPENDARSRHRGAVRRKVLLPRREGGASPPSRCVLPRGDRSIVQRRSAGEGENHQGGRIPGEARGGRGQIFTGGERRAPERGRREDRHEFHVDGRAPCGTVQVSCTHPPLPVGDHRGGARHCARQDAVQD
mmetsp:Transcript_22317/g.66141  ORF Transcript_22317/g.66141 Transcript_22317/m.66141 type:complete len:302 (-) Transcript_22317:619-1524(-)